MTIYNPFRTAKGFDPPNRTDLAQNRCRINQRLVIDYFRGSLLTTLAILADEERSAIPLGWTAPLEEHRL